MARNKILVSICLMLLSLTTMAEIGQPRNNLCVGANAGIAMNTVDFDPTIKQKQHLGPTVGLSMKYTSEKYFTTYCALYCELNYTKLGWKEDIRDQNSLPLPDSYSRDINYIQLPIFARLALGKENKGLQFFFQVGPQFGFCIGESAKQSTQWTLDDSGKPSRPNNVYEQYQKDVEHKFDYGITGGLGLEYNSPIGHFILEGRYCYGLGDMFGNSKKDPFARSANSTIFIKMAYLFDLKR